MSNARKPTRPTPPRKRARLVRIIVQPVMMIDDGNTLEEFAQEPIVLSPAEWANNYSNERWPREIAAFEEQLNQAE